MDWDLYRGVRAIAVLVVLAILLGSEMGCDFLSNLLRAINRWALSH